MITETFQLYTEFMAGAARGIETQIPPKAAEASMNMIAWQAAA